MKKIKVASLNQQRYAETFAVFVEHSMEYPLMLAKLTNCTKERLKQGFRILDIGAGTGHVLQEWMNHTDLKPSYYTAFEPNESHHNELVETIDSLGVDNDINNVPFTLETSLSQKYDIALFSHSLYWMPAPAKSLIHASRFLKQNGLVLAFIGGPYGVHAMFPLFESYVERETPMLQNNTISSHEVIQGLRIEGVEPETTMLPSPIDLTDLFEPQAMTKLSEFISFCMQLEFSNLPMWLQTDIIQYIRGGCVQQGDKLYWYLPTAAIIINCQNNY